MSKEYKYKLVFSLEFEIDQADNKKDLELIMNSLRLGKKQKGELKIISNK